MNRIVFDDESESSRNGAAEAAVAGLESIMDDNSGELPFAYVICTCWLHVLYSCTGSC